MKRTTYYSIGSTSGGLLACAVMSLHQDHYGRVAYAQHVLDNWTDSHYTVPGALVVIVLVVLAAAWTGLRAGRESFQERP